MNGFCGVDLDAIFGMVGKTLKVSKTILFCQISLRSGETSAKRDTKAIYSIRLNCNCV